MGENQGLVTGEPAAVTDEMRSYLVSSLPGVVKPVRLGEELPVFCERCGYSLHGMPQKSCDRCAIRHFHCPECGHTQPINTLRPAVQRVLGRMLAWVLATILFFKILFIGFFLFMWFIMGAEWAYTYNTTRAATGLVYSPAGPYPVGISGELLLSFAAFGLAFGMVTRMLLLRWKAGALVGVCVGVLVVAAVLLGGRFSQWDRSHAINPITLDFVMAALMGFAGVVAGAAAVWPVWVGLAHLFLPNRTAAALLDWQRGLSTPGAGAAALTRDG